MQKSQNLSGLDSQVYLEWLGLHIRPLSARPWKKSQCMLAIEVWMEIDNNGGLIVGDPQGILGRLLGPHPIELNIIIIIRELIIQFLNLTKAPAIYLLYISLWF